VLAFGAQAMHRHETRGADRWPCDSHRSTLWLPSWGEVVASAEVARAAARPLVGALARAIVLSVLAVMLHLPDKAFYVILGLVMAGPIWAILAHNRLAKGSGKDALSMAAECCLRSIYYTEDDVSAAVATLNNARINPTQRS
jgi:hypothetical protein